MIQRSIEDSLSANGKNSNTGILKNIPDAMHGFETAVEKKATEKKGHHRLPSAAETLVDLRLEMDKLQHSEDTTAIPSEQVKHNADLFVTNAITLLKQRQKKAQIQEPVQPMTDPARRWANLREAVQDGKVQGIPKSERPETQNIENKTSSFSEPVADNSSGNNDPKKTDAENADDEQGSGRRPQSRPSSFRGDLKNDIYDFAEWSKIGRRGAFRYIRNVTIFLLIPLLGAATVCYYAFDNPPPCDTKVVVRTEGNSTQVTREEDCEETISISYWLLFTVRQIVTFSLARLVQAILVDFICLRTRLAVRLLGAHLTLWTVQSRGWPFLSTWWGLLDLALVYGKYSFARHWLFFQSTVGMFNEMNPSGHLTKTENYRTIVITAICLGVAVTAKRFWVGLYLGRQTFSRYAADLTRVLQKTILIGQVASLARDLKVSGFQLDDFNVRGYDRSSLLQKQDSNRSNMTTAAWKPDLNHSQRVRLNELLGEWEEPVLKESEQKDEDITVASIIHFRRSLRCFKTSFPFTVAFGLADTRENCISSAEALYSRLLLATPDESSLNFDVLALLAIGSDGSMKDTDLRQVVSVFRPERDGSLSIVDFCKSVDTVFRELKVLQASVANSSRIDGAFEKIFNTVFYFIVACIVLSVIGVDPLVLFASISGFIIGFSFMVGSAASKYFEGILLILVSTPTIESGPLLWY